MLAANPAGGNDQSFEVCVGARVCACVCVCVRVAGALRGHWGKSSQLC